MMSKWRGLMVMMVVFAGLCGCQQNPGTNADDSIYLFSYFLDNGQDGLHLAHSRDGLNWEPVNQGKSLLTPAAGNDKLMRDPCILPRPDGEFHMVWTVSWQEKGLGYAHSRDLMHWSQQKYIPVMEQEPDAQNCWAPEVFYDDVKRQYLIFWATTIPGRFPETDGQGRRKHNHRIYCTTTGDFEKFTPARLLYEQGFNVIDSTIAKIAEGRYAMFLKDETNKPFTPQQNIRVAWSAQPEGPWGKPSAPITGAYWAEGPTAIKIGEYWMVYFDKFRDHCYGAVRSRDLQNWEDISDQLHFPTGIRHGTIFRVSQRVFAQLPQ